MHNPPISLANPRTVPRQFSWVDQRLVRERYIDQLSHEACTLYLFLVTVADAQGLSYYADASLCQRLSLTSTALHQARQALITRGLVAYHRLREQGFTGGYSIVKAYVRTVRPKRQPAFLKLAFAPGECAQVDWGSFGSVPVGQTQRRLSFFVMVLCYSRMMYVEFTVSQTMEHFLACHQHAFEFFGGIPHKVMVDNLKSAVLTRALGEAPVLNPKYLDFATHHGFTIAPCNVGKGNEKGRVENGVGYVKKNVLAGLEIPDFSVLHPAARHWLDTVANARVHGETKTTPITLWHKERPSLRPLPLHPFDIATVSQVRASRQFRITLDTNRYSVPAHYAGQALTLKTYPDRLCLSHHHQ